jgi:FAD/FMN-containing dehydrogenase
VCPVGVVGHTGVAGLTLGGGMGRLQRRFGLTIDNLLGVELVTADGRSARVSPTDNPELFWAMRGAGANFGVVTAFEFRLHPLPPTVTRGSHIYPATRFAEVWPMFRDFAASAPDYMHLAINVGLAVPEADYPASIYGQPIVTFGYLHSGAVGDVDRDLAPLASIAPAELVTRYEQPYLEVQALFDSSLGWGHRDYSKGGFANDVPIDAWNRLSEAVVRGPAGAAFGVWAQGGEMARVDEDDTAFTGRSALFDIAADVTWDDPQADATSVNWAREQMALMEPYTVTGRYVNEQSDTTEQVARESYGTDKYARLVALKRTWDPDNVFRLNQNIRP